MTDIVGIHGISQQQGGRHQLLDAWRPALRDGIERYAGRDRCDPLLDLVYYGDLFLDSLSETKGPAVLEYQDDDSLEFLLELQEELVDPATAPDVVVAAKGFKKLPLPVAGLATWLDDRFGVAGKILFFGDLVQVRRYQRNEELAAEVYSRAKEILAAHPHPRVLIGHSLGSVVGYELLCSLPGHGVETLITLGSPLGLRSVRNGLRPAARSRIPLLPPGVTRWVNVYDQHDPVTCAGGLTPHWAEAVDRIVNNGSDAHAIRPYLGKRETGEGVVTGLESI